MLVSIIKASRLYLNGESTYFPLSDFPTGLEPVGEEVSRLKQLTSLKLPEAFGTLESASRFDRIRPPQGCTSRVRAGQYNCVSQPKELPQQ